MCSSEEKISYLTRERKLPFQKLIRINCITKEQLDRGSNNIHNVEIQSHISRESRITSESSDESSSDLAVSGSSAATRETLVEYYEPATEENGEARHTHFSREDNNNSSSVNSEVERRSNSSLTSNNRKLSKRSPAAMDREFLEEQQRIMTSLADRLASKDIVLTNFLVTRMRTLLVGFESWNYNLPKEN